MLFCIAFQREVMNIFDNTFDEIIIPINQQRNSILLFSVNCLTGAKKNHYVIGTVLKLSLASNRNQREVMSIHSLEDRFSIIKHVYSLGNLLCACEAQRHIFVVLYRYSLYLIIKRDFEF